MAWINDDLVYSPNKGPIIKNALIPCHGVIMDFFSDANGSDTSHSCPIARPITTLFSPYTYPLLIEFSVLVIGLYINVLENAVPRTDERTNDHFEHGHSQKDPQPVYHNTYEGLVMGWLSILVALMFVLFMMYDSYTLTDNTLYVDNVYAFNLVVSVISVLAALWVINRLRNMEKCDYQSTRHDKREYALLSVTCFCTAVYSVCCVVAGIHQKTYVLVGDGCVALVGAFLTAYIIIFMAPNRRLKSAEQRAIKPGRQGLELLRCSNLSQWLVNTFLLKSSTAMIPLNNTFGSSVWPIFANIVQPMTILFYFHSIMCLSHVIAHLHGWHSPSHPEETDEDASTRGDIVA